MKFSTLNESFDSKYGIPADCDSCELEEGIFDRLAARANEIAANQHGKAANRAAANGDFARMQQQSQKAHMNTFKANQYRAADHNTNLGTNAERRADREAARRNAEAQVNQEVDNQINYQLNKYLDKAKEKMSRCRSEQEIKNTAYAYWDNIKNSTDVKYLDEFAPKINAAMKDAIKALPNRQHADLDPHFT